jgi:hypothetical protein
MENGQFERLLYEIAASRRHTDEIALQLRGEILESRRLYEVVAEGLSSKIELVADGVLTVDAKVERLRGDVNAEFIETRAMIKLSYAELDRRLRAVESAHDH